MRNKTKLIVIASTTLVALSLNFAPVFAEDNTTTSTSARTTLSVEQKQRFELEKAKLIEKVKDEKIKHEKVRVQELQKVAQNQINRSQKELDRMQDIISRIKMQRLKLNASATTTTDSSVNAAANADLAKIDALIVQAETLKLKIDKEIADAKIKQAAFVSVLPKVENQIKSSTSVTSADPVTNTPASATIVQSVKEFQASMKIIKKDLNLLHQNLQQIVKLMKIQAKANIEKDKAKELKEAEERKNNSTSTHTHTSAGDEENK